MNSTLRIALRNLGRNRKRTALALGAIAVAQTALLSMDGLVHGYSDAMMDALTGPMVGHVQVHAPDFREDKAMDLVLEDVAASVTELRARADVSQASARIYAPALAAVGEDGHMSVVVGMDPEAEAAPGGLFSAIAEGNRPTGRNVWLGRGLARQMDISLGDEIAIVGQAVDGSIANDLFTVAGVLTTPVDVVNRLGILMTVEAAQELLAMEDQAHEIVIRGADPEQARALSAAIGALPRFENAEVLPWQELAPELTTMIEMNEISTWIILLFVFIAAAAGVANTMLMATFERSKELGMLLALGTEPRRIVAMVLVEAVALGVLGVAVGCVLGAGIVEIMASGGLDFSSLSEGSVNELSFGGLNYQLSIVPRLLISDIVGGVVAVIVTSVLAALWPAWTASRLEPVEAMR